jgi:branched-chain amino acid transport system ATP-binding protein
VTVPNVHTHYGSSHILFDIGLKVSEGHVVCLLGRNGAGKTTTMRTIMGARATGGEVK